MNKSQLINAVAESVNLSKVDVKRVVDELFLQMEKKLDEGDKVVLSGFGVFSTANTAERQGRNPRTGEAVRIAARRSVRFHSNMDIK
ncbi:MAG: HU family DNA-binding protein [Alistipes sp.]|nr:HU family DNA-binding protein [Alistipes sp.]MBO7194798.1 HU family DNA-binding protein [Alistipes sp.]